MGSRRTEPSSTIDPATGKATLKSKLDTALPEGAMATVDFNPAADRLRIIGSDGTNLRANVDDGKVTKDGSLQVRRRRHAQGQDARRSSPAPTPTP